jgi:hypothetical protein
MCSAKAYANPSTKVLEMTGLWSTASEVTSITAVQPAEMRGHISETLTTLVSKFRWWGFFIADFQL